MNIQFNQSGIKVFNGEKLVYEEFWKLPEHVKVYCEDSQHNETCEEYTSFGEDVVLIQHMDEAYNGIRDEYFYTDESIYRACFPEQYEYYGAHKCNLVRLSFEYEEPVPFGTRVEYGKVNVEVVIRDYRYEEPEEYQTTIRAHYDFVHQFNHELTVAELIEALSRFDGSLIVSIGNPIRDIYLGYNGKLYLHAEEEDDYEDEED